MLKEQTSKMLVDGALMQEGGSVDPVSGNKVPYGAMQEEVRDDIPAQLSEGEFVFPADVVRYIGLERLMMMRQAAKKGLMKMEDMGQMSNGEEGTEEEDTAEFESQIDEIIGVLGGREKGEQEEYEEETKKMAVGGMATEEQPMAQPAPAVMPPTPQDTQMQDMQRVAAAPASSMSTTQIIKQDMGADPAMAKDLLGKVASNKAVLMRDSNTVFVGESLDYGIVKLHTFTADDPEALPAATTKIVDTLKTAGAKEIQGTIKDPGIIPALEQAGYTPEVMDNEYSIKLEGVV